MITRYIVLFVALLSVASAAEPEFKDAYGGVFSGCIVATDIDDGDPDRIGPLAHNSMYSVFCYDSATLLGIACKIKQGDSTVDASTGEGADGEGELLFAGEKTMVFVTYSYRYISFEPLADGTTQIGVACKRN